MTTTQINEILSIFGTDINLDDAFENDVWIEESLCEHCIIFDAFVPDDTETL